MCAAIQYHTTGEWVYGAIPVLPVLHLLALACAYRNRPGAGETGRSPDRNAMAVGEEATDRVHAEDVECRECPEYGTVNARGDRFCRHYVGELPGGVSVLEQPSRAESRRTP